MDSYVSFGGHLICRKCVTRFPFNQVDEHHQTKHHVRCSSCTPGIALCEVCKHRAGSNHELSNEHTKALRLVKRLEERSWDQISVSDLPKLVSSNACRTNRLLLREEFDGQATTLSILSESELSYKHAETQDFGSKALLATLVELEKMRTMKPFASPYHEVLDLYDQILCYSDSDETSRSVWVLQNPFLKASRILEAIKSAGSQVLDEDGFWVVNNKSAVVNPGKNHLNLDQLLTRSEVCKMKLHKHKFGTSSKPLTMCKVGENDATYLYDFIVKTMAIEKKMDELMGWWVGDGERADIFREALFYHMPTSLDILYDQDLDINRHSDSMGLNFKPQGRESLVDSNNTAHLDVGCLDASDNTVFEIYGFSLKNLEAIGERECKVAHSISLLDDAFGECVKRWCESVVRPNRALEVICGVNRGAIIALAFGTRTSVHVEDGLFGTFNYLVVGAPKIWYYVPLSSSLEFKEYLGENGRLGSFVLKKCYAQAFTKRKKACNISKEDMHRFGVRRIVQHPGMTVMSIPGLMYHWTISTGFSLAESTNFFINVGQDLRGLKDLWSKYHSEALGSRRSAAMTTATKYFDLCRSFKLF